MERLTHRDEGGKSYILICCDPEKPAEVHREQVKKEKAVIEKLAHYEDLEEAGRLVELPCKVGDTVYCIVNKEILRGYVRRIRPFIGGDYIDIMLDVGFTIVDPFYRDGRTTQFEQIASFNPKTYCTVAYHTREEAEAALILMERKKND